MKLVTKNLARILLVFSLLLPWATTGATEFFERAGYISDITVSRFKVEGIEYRVASGAKLSSKSSSRKSFSDFRKGDEIYFKGRHVNGVHYVDMIYYEKPDPS